MRFANPWSAYRHVATQTASPGQLVLMLYDGAIRFLERSLEGFAQDDPAESISTIHNNIVRAQNIISELSCSLNLREGGEIAANFQRLYDYLDRRLLEANLAKNADGIREVIERLTILRDAWSTMLSSGQAQEGQASETTPREYPVSAQLVAA